MNHADPNTLSGQWHAFAVDDRARMLVWRLAECEEAVAEAFVALERDDRTAAQPDLFVELNSAFTSAEEHSQRLCHELTDRYIACTREQRGEWTAPARNPEDSDAAQLVRRCSDFAAHRALPRHLVLVLQPREVSDEEAYRAWLMQIARELPASLRILILEPEYRPDWQLRGDDAERVVARPAALDVMALYSIDMSKRGESTADLFRWFYLGHVAALERGALGRALQHAGLALAISKTSEWFHWAARIHCRLGDWLRLEGCREEAKSHYRAAEECAVRGGSEGPPELRETCAKLRLQTRIGLGSALLLDCDYEEAVRVFEVTNQIAADCGDQAAQLDCYRLAAFSHEHAGAADAGFHCASEGFQLAKRMPAGVRDASSFPFLASTLFWLCDRTGRSALRPELEREFAALVGSA